jgi:hypothetical protein
VKRKLNREDAVMADPSTRTARTFLLSVTIDTDVLDEERVCSSYRYNGYDPNMLSIWQAGRATTAALYLFKELVIAPRHIMSSPGVQFSNPGEIALREASRIWMTAKRSCLVSIGTGYPVKSPRHHMLTRFNERTWVPSVANNDPTRSLQAAGRIESHCVALARSSIVTDSRLFQSSISMDSERRFSYYRFNIQGNLDLEERNQEYVALRTADYMREERGSSNFNMCVQDLIDS